MVEPKAQDLKKLLVGRGFLVYRTREDAVYLAERVRDNLIMDANVHVALGPGLKVRFMARAQRSDFPSPSDSDPAMFERARLIVEAAVLRGFQEHRVEVAPQTDPVDGTKILDTWYGVWFEKSANSVEEVAEDVAYALSLDKVAPR